MLVEISPPPQKKIMILQATFVITPGRCNEVWLHVNFIEVYFLFFVVYTPRW